VTTSEADASQLLRSPTRRSLPQLLRAVLWAHHGVLLGDHRSGLLLEIRPTVFAACADLGEAPRGMTARSPRTDEQRKRMVMAALEIGGGGRARAARRADSADLGRSARWSSDLQRSGQDRFSIAQATSPARADPARGLEFFTRSACGSPRSGDERARCGRHAQPAGGSRSARSPTLPGVEAADCARRRASRSAALVMRGY